MSAMIGGNNRREGCNDRTFHRRDRSERGKPERLRQLFLPQANKELEDAGAKHIAGGFNETVSLFRYSPKNRYVVIQFEELNASGKVVADQPAPS